MIDPPGLALLVTLALIGLIQPAWSQGLNWTVADPLSRAAFVAGRPIFARPDFVACSAMAAAFFAAIGVVWIA